jgi:hypothetical protein
VRAGALRFGLGEAAPLCMWGTRIWDWSWWVWFVGCGRSAGIFASLAALMFNCVNKDEIGYDYYSPYGDDSEWRWAYWSIWHGLIQFMNKFRASSNWNSDNTSEPWLSWCIFEGIWNLVSCTWFKKFLNCVEWTYK